MPPQSPQGARPDPLQSEHFTLRFPRQVEHDPVRGQAVQTTSFTHRTVLSPWQAVQTNRGLTSCNRRRRGGRRRRWLASPESPDIGRSR